MCETIMWLKIPKSCTFKRWSMIWFRTLMSFWQSTEQGASLPRDRQESENHILSSTLHDCSWPMATIGLSLSLTVASGEIRILLISCWVQLGLTLYTCVHCILAHPSLRSAGTLLKILIEIYPHCEVCRMFKREKLFVTDSLSTCSTPTRLRNGWHLTKCWLETAVLNTGNIPRICTFWIPPEVNL